MKKLFILILFLFFFKGVTIAQPVSCQDLLEFVVENGYKKASIPSYILNSSWLFKVTAYSYDNKTFVVAEIKRNEYSMQTDTYIFCGIPNYNWQNFQMGSYNDSKSYGERFHKYIMDYTCDCR